MTDNSRTASPKDAGGERVPERFEEALLSMRHAPRPRGLVLDEVPAPRRLAPYAAALTAETVQTEGGVPIATGNNLYLYSIGILTTGSIFKIENPFLVKISLNSFLVRLSLWNSLCACLLSFALSQSDIRVLMLSARKEHTRIPSFSSILFVSEKALSCNSGGRL